jgi:hypothetical protein
MRFLNAAGRWAAAWAVTVAAALFAVLVLSQRGSSPVMDELVAPAIGAAELRAGDHGFLDVHPPLARTLLALPLLAGDVPIPYPSTQCDPDRPSQWCVNRFAISFFYQDGVADPDALLDRSRRVNQGFAAIATGVATWTAYALGGGAASAITGLLFLTSPLWIAHSRIATNDLVPAVFGLLAMIALASLRSSGRRRDLVLLGLFTGMATAAKFSAIPFALGVALVLLGDALVRPERFPAFPRIAAPRVAAVAALGTVALVGVTAVLLAYGGDASRLAADLGRMAARADEGHPAYFLGRTSRTGWLAYFPVALLVKAPLGTLGLTALALGVGAAAIRRAGLRALWTSWAPPFALPGGVYMVYTVAAGVNIGLRYWLPLVPVLFIGIGVVLARTRKRWIGAATAVLIVVNVASVSRAWPDYLAYFNEAAGGPAHGDRYLSDSNLDWGQDLERLARVLAEHRIDTVTLAYFGAAPPAHYGIRYEALYDVFRHEDPDAGPPLPTPDYLAVSVTLLTGQYLRGLEWLRDRVPALRAGWSIRVYDLSRDADAHRRLAAMYEALGHPRTARGHLERARSIEAQVSVR